MSHPIPPRDPEPADNTPLGAVLAVTFFASLGTGVFWNAISFVAKHGYDFSQTRTLMLYLIMGVVYAIGATQAGPITRVCARWASPRTLLLIGLAFEGVACFGPVLVADEWALWVATLGVTVASSMVWPLTETYVSAGRHGPTMRSAIGWFNLTWMTSVAVPLLLMGPLLEHHARWTIGGVAFAHLLAMTPVAWFRARPGRHDPEVAGAHVPGEYSHLLRSARVLLPVSYLLNAALSPILPYRFEAIGADVRVETPIAAIWMVVRVGIVALMWRVGFWHGRWGTLLVAGLAMTGGFGLVVLAPSLLGMQIGFASFGAGLGLVYYAALYYGMAVGHADVDAGGRHEALIGAGYAIGPAAGLAGGGLASLARSAGHSIGAGAAIVGIVWGLVAIGAVSATRPYLHARRERSTRGRLSP